MLLQKLQADLKQAQLNRDEVRVLTLRLLLSEIKNMQIQKGGELSDADVVLVARKEAKKRRESIESFKSGGRDDLASKEEAELEILNIYLPAQLTQEELTVLVMEAIKELGASSLADMGKIMGIVMGKVAGRADGNIVSQIVKEELSK